MTPPFFWFPQISLAQMTPNVMKHPEMQKTQYPKSDPTPKPQNPVREIGGVLFI